LPCSTVSVVLKYDALTNILTGKYEGIYQESQPVNGKPSWKNKDNAIWYLESEKNWLIGPLKWIGYDAAYIHASDSFDGLTDYRNQWKYWDGSSWKASSDSNDVSVTCKDANLNGKSFWIIVWSNLTINLSYFFTGSCQVNQECISIKKCPYTQKLFSQIKSTKDPELKSILIEALRLLVCGKPSDRTVCCDIDQGN